MNIDKIKATNIEMTDAIRTYVEEKINHLAPMLERFGEATCIAVEVGKTTQHHHKGDIFRCEINVSCLPGKKMIRVEEVEDDLYKAIVAAKRVLEREIKEFRDKLTG